MAIKNQVVVTDRRLQEYHNLLMTKMKNEHDNLENQINNQSINNIAQTDTIIFYGGSASDVMLQDQEAGET